MIKISDKKDCCGCGACKNVCPGHCIDMKPDHEGFLYPEVDAKQCISCNLCEAVCPIKNVAEDIPFKQDAYIVQIKNERIREESTAGGAFTAIADYIIDNNGIVFGAAYDEEFKVIHTDADSKEKLAKFRNSKYVQSDTNNTFSKVKQLLEKGTMVCYSGTPCQIEGLKSFLRKDYDNLVTVDVVCHAVPSPAIFRKYIQMQKRKYGDSVSNILFRDKHYGYKYSTMTIKNADGKKVYAFGIDTDPMLRAFFSNICDRPACYECSFKKRYRVSDFTIWDCFPVYKFDKSMDDDKGTTRLLVHSDRGRRIFTSIKEQFRYTRVDADELTKNVREMFYSVPVNPERDSFFSDADILSGEELFAKYFPETFKVKLERFMRFFLIRTGIYSVAKRAVNKVMKK